jgi:hypothetical protein
LVPDPLLRNQLVKDQNFLTRESAVYEVCARCFPRGADSLCLAGQNPAPQPSKHLEELQNKTILVFTPHPDHDFFGAGGVIALLNRNHNKVYNVVYTNDDKGFYDYELAAPGANPPR